MARGGLVGPNTAVLVKRDAGDPVWYVQDALERRPFGSVVFLAPNDKFWLGLVGKNAGDTVSIGNTGKTAVIGDVRNKYAVICNECMTLYQKQFPDKNDFQSIPVTAPGDETEMSRQLKEKIVDLANYGSYVRKLIVAQRNGSIPLPYVARLLGKNLVELYQGLSESEPVYSGIPGALPLNRNDAITALVVDPITALTFSRLQVFAQGVPQKWSVVYTHSTLSVLKEATNELEIYSRSGDESIVSLDGEHFELVRRRRETIERQLLQVQHAITWLHDHASARPCDPILAYRDKQYEQAIAVIGNSEFEAIVLAQGPSNAFVSDELVVRRVAMSERSTSVSTQDVLRWAVDGGLISQRDYGTSLLQLYQNNVRGVYVDVAAITDICNSAEWNLARLPKGIFNVLSADNMGNAGAAIAGHLASEVWLRIQSKAVRELWWSLLVNAIAVGSRSSVDSLRTMLQSMEMDGRLHLVPQAVKELEGVVQTWLRTNIVSVS
jgi:hypothetical protein